MASDCAVGVTVCWSAGSRQWLEVALCLPQGSCIADALRQSRLLSDMPDTEVDTLLTGVWGHKQAPDYVLREGDRVEVYRPLKVDPKVARRERFVRQGARGTGLFSKRRAGAKSGY